MPSENIITGLDIGSSHIRMVVGQVSKGPTDSAQLNIIGVVEVPSLGVNKGSVVAIEDAVSCVSSCLEKAERMIGLPILKAYVGIGGTHISSQESNGVIAITKKTGEIQDSDVLRVIESARSVSAPVNYEVLHVIPKTFSVDNQTGVKDPVGMSGIRLEATTQIIRGLASQISNIERIVHRCGLDINDLIFSGLSSAEAVLNSKQKEMGVAVVDIGAATTKVVVFEEGDILHVAVLAIGADHVTGAIAICLQTSLEVAERLKLDIGSANPETFEKDDNINLRDFGGEDQTFSKKYIAQIIEARVEEIFKKVDKELQKINRSGLLQAGLVLVGGGAKLKGIVEAGKKNTMLPVSLGVNKRFNSAVDKVNDVSFSSALGLILLGFGNLGKDSGKNTIKMPQSVGKAIDGVKKWFKNLIS